MDILQEIDWRYGGEEFFIFSKRKNIEGAVPVTDIIETDSWKNRIWILEEEMVVYINF